MGPANPGPGPLNLMLAIPLGRINVPAAGTPVALSLTTAQSALLNLSGNCAMIEVWPDSGNTGTVYVKNGGVIIAPLPTAASRSIYAWRSPDNTENRLNPLLYQVDAATNNDGAYVTLWVE